jgi:hypothetical protein
MGVHTGKCCGRLPSEQIGGGLLPTPRANSAMTVNLRTQQGRPELQRNLETVMAWMLPTPCTTDFNDASYHHPPSAGNTRGEKLAWAVGKHLGTTMA